MGLQFWVAILFVFYFEILHSIYNISSFDIEIHFLLSYCWDQTHLFNFLFSLLMLHSKDLFTFFSRHYIETCVKRPLKNRQNKVLMTNGSLMKVESIAECYTFDLHYG